MSEHGGGSWLEWKRSCHRLLNDQIRTWPDITGQRGSLHALLSALLDHCSSANRDDDGRLVCWPAIESDEPGRGLHEWLGQRGAYLRKLSAALVRLGVIDVRRGPTSRDPSRHPGWITLSGSRQRVGRGNVYFVNVAFGVETTVQPVLPAPPAAHPPPRPIPMRPKAPRAVPWFRAGNLPDLPKPLCEEWDRTKGCAAVTEYVTWLRRMWGERRADEDAFAFHKREWDVFKRQQHQQQQATVQQSADAEMQQQVRERLEKRAAGNG